MNLKNEEDQCQKLSLEFSEDQGSDSGIKIVVFSVKFSSKFLLFPIDTLMLTIKPDVTEKNEFEDRERRILIAIFRIFQLSRFEWKIKINR